MYVLHYGSAPISQSKTKVLKLCDGAIAHVSTVTGGNPAVTEEGVTPAEDEQDSENANATPGGGATTYVVMAGEDGAVRFYDLKFRLEVRPVRDPQERNASRLTRCAAQCDSRWIPHEEGPIHNVFSLQIDGQIRTYWDKGFIKTSRTCSSMHKAPNFSKASVTIVPIETSPHNFSTFASHQHSGSSAVETCLNEVHTKHDPKLALSNRLTAALRLRPGLKILVPAV